MKRTQSPPPSPYRSLSPPASLHNTKPTNTCPLWRGFSLCAEWQVFYKFSEYGQASVSPSLSISGLSLSPWQSLVSQWQVLASSRHGPMRLMGAVAVYSIQYSVFCIQYTVYSIQYTVYSMQYTVWSIQYTVYSIQYTVYSIQYSVYSIPTK